MAEGDIDASGMDAAALNNNRVNNADIADNVKKRFALDDNEDPYLEQKVALYRANQSSLHPEALSGSAWSNLWQETTLKNRFAICQLLTQVYDDNEPRQLRFKNYVAFEAACNTIQPEVKKVLKLGDGTTLESAIQYLTYLKVKNTLPYHTNIATLARQDKKNLKNNFELRHNLEQLNIPYKPIVEALLAETRKKYKLKDGTSRESASRIAAYFENAKLLQQAEKSDFNFPVNVKKKEFFNFLHFLFEQTISYQEFLKLPENSRNQITTFFNDVKAPSWWRAIFQPNVLFRSLSYGGAFIVIERSLGKPAGHIILGDPLSPNRIDLFLSSPAGIGLTVGGSVFAGTLFGAWAANGNYTLAQENYNKLKQYMKAVKANIQAVKGQQAALEQMVANFADDLKSPELLGEEGVRALQLLAAEGLSHSFEFTANSLAELESDQADKNTRRADTQALIKALQDPTKAASLKQLLGFHGLAAIKQYFGLDTKPVIQEVPSVEEDNPFIQCTASGNPDEAAVITELQAFYPKYLVWRKNKQLNFGSALAYAANSDFTGLSSSAARHYQEVRDEAPELSEAAKKWLLKHDTLLKQVDNAVNEANANRNKNLSLKTAIELKLLHTTPRWAFLRSIGSWFVDKNKDYGTEPFKTYFWPGFRILQTVLIATVLVSAGVSAALFTFQFAMIPVVLLWGWAAYEEIWSKKKCEKQTKELNGELAKALQQTLDKEYQKLVLTKANTLSNLCDSLGLSLSEKKQRLADFHKALDPEVSLEDKQARAKDEQDNWSIERLRDYKNDAIAKEIDTLIKLDNDLQAFEHQEEGESELAFMTKHAEGTFNESDYYAHRFVKPSIKNAFFPRLRTLNKGPIGWFLRGLFSNTKLDGIAYGVTPIVIYVTLYLVAGFALAATPPGWIAAICVPVLVLFMLGAAAANYIRDKKNYEQQCEFDKLSLENKRQWLTVERQFTLAMAKAKIAAAKINQPAATESAHQEAHAKLSKQMDQELANLQILQQKLRNCQRLNELQYVENRLNNDFIKRDEVLSLKRCLKEYEQSYITAADDNDVVDSEVQELLKKLLDQCRQKAENIPENETFGQKIKRYGRAVGNFFAREKDESIPRYLGRGTAYVGSMFLRVFWAGFRVFVADSAFTKNVTAYFFLILSSVTWLTSIITHRNDRRILSDQKNLGSDHQAASTAKMNMDGIAKEIRISEEKVRQLGVIKEGLVARDKNELLNKNALELTCKIEAVQKAPQAEAEHAAAEVVAAALKAIEQEALELENYIRAQLTQLIKSDRNGFITFVKDKANDITTKFATIEMAIAGLKGQADVIADDMTRVEWLVAEFNTINAQVAQSEDLQNRISTVARNMTTAQNNKRAQISAAENTLLQLRTSLNAATEKADSLMAQAETIDKVTSLDDLKAMRQELVSRDQLVRLEKASDCIRRLDFIATEAIPLIAEAEEKCEAINLLLSGVNEASNSLDPLIKQHVEQLISRVAEQNGEIIDKKLLFISGGILTVNSTLEILYQQTLPALDVSWGKAAQLLQEIVDIYNEIPLNLFLLLKTRAETICRDTQHKRSTLEAEIQSAQQEVSDIQNRVIIVYFRSSVVAKLAEAMEQLEAATTKADVVRTSTRIACSTKLQLDKVEQSADEILRDINFHFNRTANPDRALWAYRQELEACIAVIQQRVKVAQEKIEPVINSKENIGYSSDNISESSLFSDDDDEIKFDAPEVRIDSNPTSPKLSRSPSPYKASLSARRLSWCAWQQGGPGVSSSNGETPSTISASLPDNNLGARVRSQSFSQGAAEEQKSSMHGRSHSADASRDYANEFDDEDIEPSLASSGYTDALVSVCSPTTSTLIAHSYKHHMSASESSSLFPPHSKGVETGGCAQFLPMLGATADAKDSSPIDFSNLRTPQLSPDEGIKEERSLQRKAQ